MNLLIRTALRQSDRELRSQERIHPRRFLPDAAMYHAKSLGRDRYCFFEASMNANAQQQLQLLHDLRLALERREFLLLYQPKFDALSMALTGVEALLRWQHPKRGMVPPDQFIPAAEKARLLEPVSHGRSLLPAKICFSFEV
jgi:predicted signal transduction protein with EAL and GGDEF domain